MDWNQGYRLLLFSRMDNYDPFQWLKLPLQQLPVHSYTDVHEATPMYVYPPMSGSFRTLEWAGRSGHSSRYGSDEGENGSKTFGLVLRQELDCQQMSVVLHNRYNAQRRRVVEEDGQRDHHHNTQWMRMRTPLFLSMENSTGINHIYVKNYIHRREGCNWMSGIQNNL